MAILVVAESLRRSIIDRGGVGTAKVCKAAGGTEFLTFRSLLNAPQATEYLFGSLT